MRFNRRLTRALPLVLALAASGGGASWAPPFTSLQAGFTQEVFGHTPGFLGGVGFAPDGDVWADFCTFSGSPLVRFDLQSLAATCGSTNVHPEVAGSPFPSNAGCGLTNHPSGDLFSNIDDGVNGVARLDANTGSPLSARRARRATRSASPSTHRRVTSSTSGVTAGSAASALSSISIPPAVSPLSSRVFPDSISSMESSSIRPATISSLRRVHRCSR